MTRSAIIALFLVIASMPAFAATFTATVDGTSISDNGGVPLHLELSGATAKAGPDLHPLEQQFEIVEEARTSSTEIVNGRIASSAGWDVTLMPRANGRVTIPPIPIATDQGNLSTQPIALDVTPAEAARTRTTTQGEAGKPVAITAAASSPAPYQNEPFIYTVQIVAHRGLGDLSVGDLTADNAVIEPEAQPVVKNAVENGRPVKIVQFRYVITPLKAGPLTISPVTVRGAVAADDPLQAFEGLGDAFADPARLFAQMRRLSGFAGMSPFEIATGPASVDVKAPAAAIDPWLPLKDLQISEKVEAAHPIEVGDPILRTVTLRAVGAGGSQLPSVKDQLRSPDFKLYADTPKTSEKIDQQQIAGAREENFNLIPMKPGSLTLPSVKVAWWDTVHDRLAYAELPARVVDVLQASAGPTTPNQAQPVAEKVAPMPAVGIPVQKTATVTNLWRWYGLGAILALFALLTAWFYRRRLNEPSKNQASIGENATPPVADKERRHTIQWDTIEAVDDLKRALLSYASNVWGIAPNKGLEAVCGQLKSKCATPKQEQELDEIIHEISEALYAGGSPDLQELKRRCAKIIRAIGGSPHKIKQASEEKLPDLNPS